MGILDAIIQNKHTQALRVFEPDKIVEEILMSVKEREKQILMKRYGLKGSEIKTLAAIGLEHNLTRERVRQIEKDLLKTLKKSAKTNSSLALAKDVVIGTINEHGKIMAEDTLLKAMGIKSESDRNSIIFILHLIEEIDAFTHESYKKCWSSVTLNKQLLFDFTNHAHSLLNSSDIPMPEKDFLDNFFRHEFYVKNQSEFSEKIALNYLGLANKIEKNVFGHWGLVNSKQIVPKDVGDKAYLVLKQHNKPEHYSEITNLINKAKFDARVAYKETVHNELIKDKRFILVGRGIYALSEWGFKPGVVADVIKEILVEAQKPLPKDKIIEEVLKKRHVKKNTILVGLSNKQYFKKVDKNLYTLVENN
jgi:hypothetical protein